MNKPIVKCQDDMVVLVVNMAQAHIIRTLFGSVLPSDRKFVDPVYDALVKNFNDPLPFNGSEVIIDYSKYT